MIAAAFTLISLGAHWLLGPPVGLARLVDVGSEGNFPTWYSSLGLLVAALLLGLVSWAHHHLNRRDFIAHWIFLSAIFILLSAEEIVGIHEVVNTLLRRLGFFSGFFRRAWVIPAGVGLLVFGLSYLRFLAALPLRRRNQFVAAGAVYVLGAVGMEMIGGKIIDLYSRGSTAYVLCYHLEEFLELCGIALFTAALIEHLAELLGPEGMRLSFSRD